MYTDYKVEWAENKTASNSNPYKKLSIVDPQGAKFDVNIFSDFPNFANIMPGNSIRGKLEQKGRFWNIISETQGKPRGGASGAYKTAQIEKVMDRKEVSIGKTLDRKEESIRLSSAQRDAVLIVNTMMSKDDEMWNKEVVKEEIIKWRNWFLNDEEFNTPPPF